MAIACVRCDLWKTHEPKALDAALRQIKGHVSKSHRFVCVMFCFFLTPFRTMKHHAAAAATRYTCARDRERERNE
jgi:hypothetical protein